MNHYTHLIELQRYQISSFIKMNASLSEIARIVEFSKSTISREIRRNKGKRGYQPLQAHKLSMSRRAANSLCITPFGWAYIEMLLQRKLSPEQITGRLRLKGWQGVPSHERIYHNIYEDKKNLYFF